MIKDIDQQINDLRYDKTLWGYERDIYGKDFEYGKLDEKILSWEKDVKYYRWLAFISGSILLIGSLIQYYQNSTDQPKDYLSKGAGFVILTISFFFVRFRTKSDLEKAKMIKFLVSTKEELGKKNEEIHK